MWAYYLIIFLIGLSLGSFFNVVIFRFNSNRSPLKGRSECLKCRLALRWYDLVPVISYFLLKGRCRNCKNRISIFYPLIEIATAAILLMFFINSPEISSATFIIAAIISIFVLILFVDLRYFIIPDKLLILLAILVVVLKLISRNLDFFALLISAFGLTLFFAIMFIVSKGRWIGFGDVKLILLIGFLFGYPAGYLVIMLSVWFAALISVILLIAKKADAKTEIPFGAFLSASSIIFLIFNESLQKISAYLY